MRLSRPVISSTCKDAILGSERPSAEAASGVRLIPFRLRWPNTVFARALADAIQRAHKDCKNQHAVDTAIILLLNFRSIFAIFLRN